MKIRSFAAPLLAAVALALSLAAPALAFEKGVRAGLNLANFRGEFADAADTEFHTGFVGGVFAAIPIGPMFSVQAEVLYSRKGAKATGEGADQAGNIFEYETTWSVDVIEVPVLARISTPPGTPFRPYLVVGPALGFQVDGRFESDSPPLSGSMDISDDLEDVDVGLVVGGGIVRRTGPVGVVFDARYTTGFSGIYKDEGDLETNHSVISFSAGIVF